MVSSITAGSNVGAAQLQNMDLETSMMMVQLDRANNLEASLKDQLKGVANRNTEMSALNKLISDLRSVRPAGANAGPDTFSNLGSDQAAGQEIYARLVAAGVKMPDAASSDAVNEPGTGIYDARQKTIDVWLEDLKGKIDALSNSQQTDMLRLQSLNNKHNESFDILTNFIKKMSDSRASIVGNMR